MEATDFLETTFNVAPDSIDNGIVDAVIAGVDLEQAQRDMESYLAFTPGSIDTESITIRPDHIEGSDMDCVQIIIKTGYGE